MKFFTKRKTVNKIVLVLAVIIAFNFISPNLQVNAEFSIQGMLLSPVRSLTLGIANGIYSIMQFLVLGDDNNTRFWERSRRRSHSTRNAFESAD